MSRVLILPTLFLALLAGISFLLSGARLDRGTLARRISRGTVVIANMDEVHTLDPGQMSWATDIRTAMALWEGLTAYDPAAHVVPGVADRWDISPDHCTYTFHLRADAQWSNGEPVRAQDFLFAWQRTMTPATGADYAELYSIIRGADAYMAALRKSEPANFADVGVKAPNDHTLVVQLTHPRGYFLDLCAFPPFYPLNARAMQPFLENPAPANVAETPPKEIGTYDGRWTRPPALVTNGPFRLKSWRFKQYLELVPNEHYWDRAHVKCPRLLIEAIADPRAALLAFDSHTVDLLTFVPAAFGEELLAQKNLAQRRLVHYQPVFGTYYYIVNCTRPPLNDKRVRRALSLAIDREQLVRDVTRMHQKPLEVIVPPGTIPGYTSPQGLKMNVPEARKLLAEAGYPGGRGMRTLEMLYNNETIHGQVAMAIGQMWARNLGIAVKYRGLERGSFGTAKSKDHDFDLARGGWYGDYTDPTTWLDLLRSDNGNNDGQFKSPAYDALMDKAAAAATPQARMADLSAAEKLAVTDEMPFIPLYQYSDGFMYDDRRLKGIEVNVRLLTPLKEIQKAD